MRLPAAALGLVLTACYSTGEGISPPLDRIYFPVGLTTDCDARIERNIRLDAALANTSSDPGQSIDLSDRGCDSNFLYVVSSDFDLQFNAGAIQVLDLKRVRDLVNYVYTPPANSEQDSLAPGTPRPELFCKELGAKTAAERATSPGRCRPIDLGNPPDKLGPIILPGASREIGAFATDVVLSYGPQPKLNRNDPDDPNVPRPKRLYVPVRGESSLHWIDLEPDDRGRLGGKLNCADDGSSTCDQKHRVGTEGTENTRGARMPTEPYGIATSDSGDAIVITNQTVGQLSLFSQDVRDYESGWKEGPKLQYLHTLPAVAAVAIAAVPESAYVRYRRDDWRKNPPRKTVNGTDEGPVVGPTDPYPPGFLVAYANAPRLDLVRYYADNAKPPRPYLKEADVIGIQANSGGTVSRGVTFEDMDRWDCEVSCASLPKRGGGWPTSDKDCTGDSQGTRECCAWTCASQSVGTYVTNRSPAGLLVGSTIQASLESPSRDVPSFADVVATSIGPSRVYVGKVLNEMGKLETRIFVVCFDQHQVIIYDPKRRLIEAYVDTGHGPHAMAFDYYLDDPDTGPRARAYVGHFTDSYIGVIELDRRKIRTFGKMILSLSAPVPPRAQK